MSSDHYSQNEVKLIPPLITIDHNLCTLCTKCVRSCPAEILIREKDETTIHKAIIKITEPNSCFECRACEVVCPVFAVSVICTSEKEMSAP